MGLTNLFGVTVTLIVDFDSNSEISRVIMALCELEKEEGRA